MISYLGILFMKAIAPLPLRWLRAGGWMLGLLLYTVVVPRRRVARRNLELCFPKLSPAEREKLLRRHFVRFAQAWLDRSWIWHGDPEITRRRLLLTGALHELAGNAPTVIFAPHFVGMDAGWTALTQQVPRRFVGIYTQQANKVLDAWALAGRNRFASGRPFGRAQGVHALASALRRGEVLYLLPDMNFGAEESIFVPFFGIQAATLPSLSRFARLGKAKVVPVTTCMTPAGYEVRVLDAWTAFPSGDIPADTALMNARLENYIDTMPDQYYWVHKRFKSRPEGEPGVY
ncbi:MAG TPA: lipid A biosynthesis acyltransferase [Ramlibacter sp.]|uniref:LpxL/LpxP family acyltransferase n=1 Tax=Ramlibacter sp. TaxID=1917967 RepID=UPI002BA36513|nr:lipid A biosynthesis acyltransferase [Ramlibacter sp.]HVZ42374.1 lipid A biosynthesis acyltransferase [Ramlibacter sp.]